MIANTIVRVFQLIFCVIVLALSITAVRWQEYGSAPAASGYNAFAGAFGTVTALIGLVAVFVSAFPGLVMVAVDALAFIILLAGGIAYAVQLRGVQCSEAYNKDNLTSQPIWYSILNGGTTTINNQVVYGLPIIYNGNDSSYDLGALKSRCTTGLADTAFLFIACIVTLAAAVLSFMAHRRGSTRRSAV